MNADDIILFYPSYISQNLNLPLIFNLIEPPVLNSNSKTVYKHS